LVEVTEKGKIMAEPASTSDVYSLGMQIGAESANIRRETAFEAGDVRRDVAKEASDTRLAGAKSAYDLQYSVGNEADRVTAQDTAYFIASTAANTQIAKELTRSQAWTEAKIDAGFVKVAGDQALASAIVNGNVALEAAKTQGALALQSAMLGQQVIQDGNATRALMHELHRHDENRALIERNAALVEAHSDARFWRHGAQNAQFAAVTSQVNALASQFQETRQGMVNFGTQTGVGQTSTSNQV
jgi:hypothetical protein